MPNKSNIKHLRTRTLTDEEDRLVRSLVDSTGAVPWEFNLAKKCFDYVGPQAVGLLGYPVDQWYQKYFWAKHLHPDDRDWVIKFCQEATSRNEDYNLEYRMVAADGDVVWIYDSVLIVRDESGPVALRGYMINITAQKQIIEALTRSKAEFEAMFRSIPDAVIFTDPERRIVMTNRAVHKMLGYTKKELIGQTTEILYADKQDFKDQGRRRYHTGSDTKTTPYTVKYKRKNGTVFWSETLGTQVKDVNDTVIGFIGMFRDITERKRAEERRRLQAAAIKSAANGIVITSLDGKIQWVNPAFTRLTGYSFEEAVGQNPRLLNSGNQDQAFYQKLWDTILAGRVWHGELINRRKDGSLYTDEQTITPVCDEQGKITHFIAIKQDISESKQIAQELQDKEAKFRMVIESALDAIIVIDDKSIINEWNPQAEVTFGWKSSEVIGRTLMETIIPDHYRQAHQQGMKKLLAKGGEGAILNKRVELTALNREGREFPIELTVAPLQTGETWTFSAFVRDLTIQKQVEAETLVKNKAIASSINAIAIADMQGVHTYVNESYIEMWGYEDIAEVLNRPNSEFVANPEELEPIMGELVQKGSWVGESVGKRKDGSTFDIQVSASTVTDEAGDPISVMASFLDITERKQAEETVRNIAAGVSAKIGEAFFRSLVEHLAKIFDSEYTFIGLLDTQRPDMIDTIALCVHGEVVPNLSYELAGTPCKHVVDGGCDELQAYPHDIQRLFPDDPMLVEMGAHSYVGAPLADTTGKPIGLIVVMDNKPMENTGRVETILRIFAARAAVEIERLQTEEKIKASEQELSTILDTMQDTYYRTDMSGSLNHVSAAVQQLLGFSPKELLGTKLADLYVDPQGREKFLLAMKEADGKLQNYEAQLRHNDGSAIWVSTNAHYLRDEQGAITGVEGTTRDVSQIKSAEDLSSRFGRILDNSSNEIYIFGVENMHFTLVNKGARMNLGYTMQEMEKLTPLDLKPDYTKEIFEGLMQPLLKGEQEQVVFQTRHLRKNGSLYPVEVNLQISRQESPPIFVAIIQDITARMQTEERLQFLAHHDALTALPNRVLFTDRLDQSIARAHRHNRAVAVLFLDLDRFKLINDTLGHDFGDRALQALAERLSDCARDGDTVARFGGDEFAIVLEDIASADDVAPTARKILDSLAQSFMLDEHEFFITTSIGISLFPIDGRDTQTLLKHADIAMYRAKDLGRNTYQFYSSDMSAKNFERLSLETSLRHALEREEFVLHYQPQLDLQSGKVTGVEALIRWQHPDLGLIKPLDFIPLLEDTGLIVPVGEWVLRTACSEVQAWNKSEIKPMRVAVNISSRQFNEPDFTKVVGNILKETGLKPSLLELEITETVLMQNVATTVETTKALNEIGVRFSIDDFGTGYSSLSYLKRFPIDTLKIDQTFIRDMIEDPEDAVLVEAIIALGRALHLYIVAEGVETEAHLKFLERCNCDCIQGYVFDPPLPAQVLLEKLKKRKSVKN